MKLKSVSVVVLLGTVGFPLAAQAGWQCAGGPKGCSMSGTGTGAAAARSGPQAMTQAQQPASAVTAESGQGNPGIVPINTRITTAKTYAELGAEWWQWAVQAPAADSPLFDTTGEKCRVGQQGPVWFLAGTLGGGDPNTQVVRTCEVPFGKAIFFPVINNAFFAFLSDPPEQRTAEFVRAQKGCDNCEKA